MHFARISFALLLAGAGAACVETLPPEPPATAPAPPPLRAPDFSPPAREADPHTLEIHLKPALDGREMAHVDVTLRFSEPPGEFAEPGPLVLAMPQREDGEAGWPDAVEEVTARDAEGTLTLRSKAIEGPVPSASPAPQAAPTLQGPGAARVEWRSDRRPVGAVSVAYRVKLSRAEGKKHGGTRALAGGFQGTGATLLLLPETADAYRVRLAWDLAAAGEGARAVTSLDGEGRVTMDRLREAMLAAGPIGRVTVDAGSARFEGAWLGGTGFDPVEALPWAARVHARGRAIFHDAETAPFTFFVRAAPGLGSVWSGGARAGGAVVLAGAEVGWTRAARFAVARSIVDHWIGGLRFDGPEGAGRWLTAGLGAHYAREILLRGGLCTPEEAADDLREHIERHAVSPARDLPNEAIAKRIGEADVPLAAEDRGMLYAADVDAAVRAKSGGKRSLDDLVVALLDKARAGAHEGGAGTLPAGAWRELIGAELGAEGQARFDAVIGRGEAFSPPDGAFGPCFKAAKKRAGKGRAAVNVTVWARDPKVAAATCARGAR
ncbi:MAG: hypothetical protein QM820_41910 [Minicystis sp.]